jgi:hypothetical protein
LPFLRVLRDKRGYETTYLMHWFREGHRQRSRILYVFRTPPGVRVGREPLDPAVIREIEAQHPDIDFDWHSLVDNQQIVEISAEPRRPRGKGRPETVQPAAQSPPAIPVVEAQKPEPGPALDVPRRAMPEPPVHAVPRIPIPAAIEGATREEQLAFLRSWYPQIRERIPHRTHDPVRIDALLALSDRLNPDVWADEEQIAAGLAHAAEALERLSRVFSKRRRRSRRRPAAGPRQDAVETRGDQSLSAADAAVSAPPDAPAELEQDASHERADDDTDADDE